MFWNTFKNFHHKFQKLLFTHNVKSLKIFVLHIKLKTNNTTAGKSGTQYFFSIKSMSSVDDLSENLKINYN